MESLNGVNAITIVFAALCIFAIAYRFYGLWVAQKVLNINAARETPANRFEDGKDYVPTNKYVLFGHHFAAIAAAGPLLGPVLALKSSKAPTNYFTPNILRKSWSRLVVSVVHLDALAFPVAAT